MSNCPRQDCEAEDVEFLLVDEDIFMCPECGEEFSQSDLSLDDTLENYVVGVVTESESIDGKKSKGLTELIVDVGTEQSLTIVTNAKYVSEGKRVVVALVGAKIGDPEDGLVVKKRSIGGVMSEGMICDAPMLKWAGGAAGQAVFLSEEFVPGSKPPMSRPRGGN